LFPTIGLDDDDTKSILNAAHHQPPSIRSISNLCFPDSMPRLALKTPPYLAKDLVLLADSKVGLTNLLTHDFFGSGGLSAW
jgi:hypothetical protein